MKNTKLQNITYTQGYETIKNFHIQMCTNRWGEGCLPSRYTEGLCKEIYGFSDRNNKSHDAISKNKKLIEIKATIGSSSATSINSKLEFDYLYWLRFDFNEDRVYVKIYSKGEVAKYLSNNLNRGRINITLNSIVQGKKDDRAIIMK